MGCIPKLMAGKRRTKKPSQSFRSPLAVARALVAGRQEAQARRLRLAAVKQAKAARSVFKPRKQDRGKIIFIGTQGQRNPTKKGRKGYVVYVTKTGKKWLIKRTKSTEPYRPRTLSQVIIPARANIRRAKKAFQSRRLVRVGGIEIVRQSGSVRTGGAHDFSETVSNKIAASLQRVLRGQASHRVFVVKFNALVKLPSGETRAISGQVDLEYADHVAIRTIGIRAYVRHKFYAELARELAFAGYVSNGSANHIRSLRNIPDPDSPGDTVDNADLEREEWLDKRGEAWTGRNKEQVEIQTIEWKIEQAK